MFLKQISRLLFFVFVLASTMAQSGAAKESRTDTATLKNAMLHMDHFLSSDDFTEIEKAMTIPLLKLMHEGMLEHHAQIIADIEDESFLEYAYFFTGGIGDEYFDEFPSALAFVGRTENRCVFHVFMANVYVYTAAKCKLPEAISFPQENVSAANIGLSWSHMLAISSEADNVSLQWTYAQEKPSSYAAAVLNLVKEQLDLRGEFPY